ncbi:hypothetical protein MSPP1_002278 [Malassezia sp. CBS 17886]|nr:hypothetical protein MSPP1_002278 [Malassezia sp. CBS 17886]
MQCLTVVWRCAALTVALLCAVQCAAAASYGAADVRVSVSSFDGTSLFSEMYATQEDVSPVRAFDVEADNVIKLSLTITRNDKKVLRDDLPHQVWVVLDDAAPANASATPRGFVWPLRVRPAAASASWSLRVDRLSAPIKRAIRAAGPDHPFRATLVIGSFAKDAHSETAGLELSFLQLRFPVEMLDKLSTGPYESARHKAAALEGFLRLPDPFLTCIVAFEALALAHWIGTPFNVVLPSAGVVSLAALLTGRSALASNAVVQK